MNEFFCFYFKSIENVVFLVFGKFVFVNWFYFEEVRVVGVLDGDIK